MTFDDIIGLIVSFYLGKLSLKEKGRTGVMGESMQLE